MHADLVDPGPSVTLNPARLCKAAKAENVEREELVAVGGARRGGKEDGCGKDATVRNVRKEREI